MTFKNIVVYVDDSEQCEKRIELAAGLATRFKANLTGVYAVTPVRIPPYLTAQIGPEIFAGQKKMTQEATDEAESRFREGAKSVGDNVSWVAKEGHAADVLRPHVLCADLVVVGQVDARSNASSEAVALPEDLVIEGGRPVLVVPYAGTFNKIGDRVLIAWNGSREAVRAADDALPFLEGAKTATVLAVNPKSNAKGNDSVSGEDFARYLKRHHVPAKAAHVFADDIDVGDMLLSRCSDNGTDLIVMGAYGRSRLRELVMGGATRHILRHMTVPVLMSH